MAKIHHKTVCGINGVSLNKVVEFLTGERSFKYEWLESEKTFLFWIKEDLVPEDKRGFIEHFKSFFKVKVKFV